MPNIDFSKIAARLGSQSNAFEELCSQIARRTCPTDGSFQRFRGAGGDGGVECILQHLDGSIIGWQAKFVFDVEGLIAQAKDSLQTALSIHEKLKKYIICFPFDPTGKTGRKTKKGAPAQSETEKLEKWIREAVKKANDDGRTLTIELWPATALQSLLLEHDVSGGVRHYFFYETILSTNWFKNHLTAALNAAGPRYTPELNVETDLWKWFSAFEAGNVWRDQFNLTLKDCQQATKTLSRQVSNKRTDAANPPWTSTELEMGQRTLAQSQSVLRLAEFFRDNPIEVIFIELLAAIENAVSSLQSIERTLAEQFELKHGEGTANSQTFRRHMAEYQAIFPAANLDAVRKSITSFNAFASWLLAPTGYLAAKKAFVLSGAGGSGKTHGICDMASKRLNTGAYTCVLFGHQFSGSPAEWTRLIESLTLPISIGKEGVLDALNAAAEGSGRPLIFCIDAINETVPRDYWINRYLPLSHEFEKRPFLKLCLSCRTSFLSSCLPPLPEQTVIEHQGFAGVEREGCNAFFQHYELEPPLVPVLQPELSNPLYLKLVCETLKSQGLKRLPGGWLGLAPVIRAFLKEKERQFAREHSTSVGAAIIAGSLVAIASAIADSASAALPWSKAQLAVNAKIPQAATFPVLEWLVKSDLLIEDGGPIGPTIGGENVLRPAFERFGDFLIASEVLAKIPSDDFATGFKSDPKINNLLATAESVEANAGLVLALSILLPETANEELPNLIDDASVRKATLSLTMRALPWRTSDTFTESTRQLAREALNDDPENTMDSLLSVSAQPSHIDAYWIGDILGALQIPKRDAAWSGYLLDRFDGGIVKRLIEATTDVDLQNLELETASRWAFLLLWFTAAADRRVKDYATRSAVSILAAKSEIIPPLLDNLINMDDDELRERVLLCTYGALIACRDKKMIKSVADNLLERYQANPSAFQNAIIRDHIRCIGELAQQFKCLDSELDPLVTSLPQQSDWPLKFPTDSEVENWERMEGAVSYVTHSCLHDDFNHYSINCLNRWMHGLPKPKIGGWILKHILDEFAIATGSCDNYDKYVAHTGGGGRSKPAWAERIGKKYQWIAMYRLASRLNDNAPQQESNEPKPLRTPLILMEERKLDPTLAQTVPPTKRVSECWWLVDGVDLPATKNLDFESWLTKKDDLPPLERLLAIKTRGIQKWVVISAYPRWSEYRSEADYGTPYRDVWINIHSYLVPKASFEPTIEALDGRNYFGEWLPQSGKWLHAFAGEYPWATPFNTEPDWYLGAGETVKGLPLKLTHSTNQVIAEWEYDATLPASLNLEVPTKKFFVPGPMWWNGTDGFSNESGKTIFYDPHVKDGGPSALLADVDDLLQRLEKMECRLIWTMLCEKNVLGDWHNRTKPLCCSQLAILNPDESVTIRKREFFD
jgi:hypothetical protein